MKLNRISACLATMLMVILSSFPGQTEELPEYAGVRAAEGQAQETEGTRTQDPVALTNEALILYRGSPPDLVRVLAENGGGYRTVSGIAGSFDTGTGEVLSASFSEFVYEEDGIPFAVGTRILGMNEEAAQESFVRVQEFSADEERRITGVKVYEAPEKETHWITTEELRSLPEDFWMTEECGIAYDEEGLPADDPEKGRTYAFDGEGRLTEIAEKDQAWRITYDASGRPEEILLLTKGKEDGGCAFEYDGDGLISGCRVTGPGISEQYAFHYDEDGRIASAEVFARDVEKPSGTFEWKTQVLEEPEELRSGYVREASYRNGLLQKIKVERLEDGRTAERWVSGFIGAEKVDESYDDFRELEDDTASGGRRQERQMAFGAWLKETGYTDGGIVFGEKTVTRWGGPEEGCPVRFMFNSAGPLHWYIPSAFSELDETTVESENGTAAFGDPGALLGLDLTGSDRYYVLVEGNDRYIVKNYTKDFQDKDDSVLIREFGGEELLDISDVLAEYSLDSQLSAGILADARDAYEKQRSRETVSGEPAAALASETEHASMTGTPATAGGGAAQTAAGTATAAAPAGTGTAAMTGAPAAGAGTATAAASAGTGTAAAPAAATAAAPAATAPAAQAASAQALAAAMPIASTGSYPEANGAVDAFFTAMSGLDSGKISSYCGSQGIPDPGMQNQIGALLQKAPPNTRGRLESLAHWGAGYTHRVTGTRMQDGNTIVTVEVSTYDLGGLMEVCISGVMSKALAKYGFNVGSAPKDELIDLFLGEIEGRKATCGRLTSSVDVICAVRDGKWVVLNSQQIIGAMKGNFNAVMDVWNRFG